MPDRQNLIFHTEYSPLGIKRDPQVPFTVQERANNAGLKSIVGTNERQTTQKPISPLGNVQSSTQVYYDSGVGWWIGFDQGVPKVFIGNADGAKITWDGSTLTVAGATLSTISSLTFTPTDQNPTVDGQVVYFDDGVDEEMRVMIGGVVYSFDLTAV